MSNKMVAGSPKKHCFWLNLDYFQVMGVRRYCQKYLRYCLQCWEGVLTDFSVLTGHTEQFSNKVKSNNPNFSPKLAK